METKYVESSWRKCLFYIIFVKFSPKSEQNKWELSQVLKFFAIPKILALEDQEQAARSLDFWEEPTDLEDSDQSDRGQPLPPPAVS